MRTRTYRTSSGELIKGYRVVSDHEIHDFGPDEYAYAHEIAMATDGDMWTRIQHESDCGV